MVRRRIAKRRTRQKIDPETPQVRKRNAWTRARDRGRRPKSPAPKEGWRLAELAALTEVPTTTVRYYVARHLLRPIEFRGTVTRYSRREFMRLLGILRLKETGTMSLEDQRARLDAMSDAELERWLASGPVPPKAAAAIGIEPDASVTASADALATAALEVGRATVEYWQRVVLLPGLDLMVRADANVAAQAAAQRICTEYLVKCPTSPGPLVGADAATVA